MNTTTLTITEVTPDFLRALADALTGKKVEKAQAKEAPAKVKEAPAAPAPLSTLESIRELVTSKNTEANRAAIKSLLSEYGAASVAKLDPKHFDEFKEKIEKL